MALGYPDESSGYPDESPIAEVGLALCVLGYFIHVPLLQDEWSCSEYCQGVSRCVLHWVCLYGYLKLQWVRMVVLPWGVG